MKYLEQLNKQKTILDPLFEKEEIYLKRYRTGGWTGKEVLIHIKDSETVFYDRLRRIISEENPILWFFEQDLWQKKLQYKRQDIHLAKTVFMITRDSTVEAIRMHWKTSAGNKGVHSRRGLMTMEQLVKFLIWHTDHHIEQLKMIKTSSK